MAKPNPYDMNSRAKKEIEYVPLEFIEDIAVDYTNPLDVLMALEDDLEQGVMVDTIREKWETACTAI